MSASHGKAVEHVLSCFSLAHSYYFLKIVGKKLVAVLSGTVWRADAG